MSSSMPQRSAIFRSLQPKNFLPLQLFPMVDVPDLMRRKRRAPSDGLST